MLYIDYLAVLVFLVHKYLTEKLMLDDLRYFFYVKLMIWDPNPDPILYGFDLFLIQNTALKASWFYINGIRII